MFEILSANALVQQGLLFPPEWVKAALVLALISIWVVIALFAYLNRITKQSYFSAWTVAWMFYSVYLAASIGLEETPSTTFLIMARRACIGISALFMFWGSFQLTGKGRSYRELGMGVSMMVVWSYLAAYKVGIHLWITIPVFALLAGAGVYTGVSCLRRRKHHRGATILGIGFLLWGLHLLAFPLVELSSSLLTMGYLTSAALALMITVGMVVEQDDVISERQYRDLFDSGSDAIFLLDPKTLTVREANCAAQKLTARSTPDLVGRSFLDLFPSIRRELPDDASAQKFVDVINQPCREFEIEWPGHASAYCEGRASLTDCPTGTVLQINVRDITARKLAENALQQSVNDLRCAMAELRHAQQQVIRQQRLNALEQMASGVAHDFNNVLARILGFAELLLARPENLDDPDKVKKYLQMISSASQDAVQIVNRLREFYRHRRDTESYTPVDLDEVVEQAVTLTQPKWKDQVMNSGATVRIETRLEPTPAVRGNALELREVLTNLIFNAVDAMPSGGTITVALRAEATQAVLAVTDTGSGMTEEIRQRCLEPFFSTKGHRGTGLGLAIVYGIVHRHNGTIEVQSELGRGSSFIIRLPIPRGKSAGVTTAAPAREGQCRTLLVEDDSQIRDILTEYLQGDGHAVETAANGTEGLEKFRASPFDLVVTDQAMPEMNGDQMALAIKFLAPQTPIVMVTGFADTVNPEAARNRGINAILPKPATQVALQQAIRKAQEDCRQHQWHPQLEIVS